VQRELKFALRETELQLECLSKENLRERESERESVFLCEGEL